MSILEIRKVTHNFKGLTALYEIDMEVREGEILGIIGPNGAGKTTLFNIISGFLNPTRGEIIYRGENIAGIRPDEIARKGIARSFQGTSLFQNTSCLGNLVIAHHLHKNFGFWQTILNVKSHIAREE